MKFYIGLILLLMSATVSAGVRDFLQEYVPNAFSLDIANNRTLISLQDRETLVTNNRSGGGILGGISATFVSKEPASGYHFAWMPVFTFAFHRLNFDSPSVFLAETDFQVFRTSLGIGPEFSYGVSFGTFYANISPGIAYSWISWSSPLSGGSMGKSNLNFATTLGFYQLYRKQIVVKYYWRFINEDKLVWKEALDSSQGFPVPVTGVINSITGLSLAWIF